jgi:hypothetical protein
MTMTTWTPGTPWRKQLIETQDTQPLPVIQPPHWKPTLQELRLYCQMSREQLAMLAGVRLCRVYWMEHGIETPLPDAIKVLHILSQVAHRQFHSEDIRGLRVRVRVEQGESVQRVNR